ncbi:MAG TPA: AsnC family transcriptional regulator [Nitrososphaera sp.]|nr:AsnC family transcriptional regulator [Nitrososphaera sp.]
MLPLQLDDTDVAILNSLMEDGRKSFRAISREVKVSTPTVKVRYERLVNIGLIKSVKPEIDLSKVDKKSMGDLGDTLRSLKKQKKHFHVYIEGLKVKLKCEFCGGPIHAKPKVLKFAGFERFFCCTQCRASYKDKHSGRIEMLKEQYRKH